MAPFGGHATCSGPDTLSFPATIDQIASKWITMSNNLIVLDVGKTHTKATLLEPDGHVLATRARHNLSREECGRKVLDADGIQAWMVATFAELAKLAPCTAIVPVGHGAAAALVRANALAAPV